MNYRNPKLLITLRVILGLFLLMSGIGGFMSLQSPDLQGIPPAMVPIMHAFVASGIFQMIKITEIVAGLMLVVGFLPQLAAIFIAPISIGVLIFNYHMSPENLPAGVFLTVLNVYLGYAYWDKYKALFKR